MEIDELKDFVETVDDFEPPGLITICMVHTIWYLLRTPPKKIEKSQAEQLDLKYCLMESRDMIYESVKSMFTGQEQPIPGLTLYAFERCLEHLESSGAVLHTKKKSKTGATIILPPDAQNPDVKPDSENICWIFFKEYDKSKVDELIKHCTDHLNYTCGKAQIYSWNELKGEKNEVDEFFDKLDPNDVNKLKIMRMIERTEVMLRRLLVTKYEKHAGWMKKKEYVPSDIISKMYTEDYSGFRGMIDKKADDASYFSGKIIVLSPVESFVNACTLGEEIEIIKYRKQNFMEKKDKETKKLEGGPFKEKELQRIIDNFEELKNIRNKKLHFDDQLKWGVERVERTKVLTDAIIEPIVNYLNK